jgi:hypothetical protein
MATRNVMLVLATMSVLLACTLGGRLATPAPADPNQSKPEENITPTDDRSSTQAVQQTVEALNAANTQLAAETQAAAKTQAAAATQAKADKMATLVAESSETRSAFSTNLAETRTAGTAEVHASATAAVQSFLKVMDDLKKDGAVRSTDGEYLRLDDFDESWAQIGWYQWYHTSEAPENFVISADAAWDSASDKSNWPEAGCGFVYAEKDSNNHSLAYLGLDGFVRLGQTVNGNGRLLSVNKYGKLDIPAGNARIMLVVDGKRVTFYVNGHKVTSAQDGRAGAGDLAYTILSGTNKGFGTRCHLTNIVLYVLK